MTIRATSHGLPKGNPKIVLVKKILLYFHFPPRPSITGVTISWFREGVKKIDFF